MTPQGIQSLYWQNKVHHEVSSDPHAATIEKQGADRGSDFNQILYFI